MALIVETGAGLANAESYASVAAADSYFAKLGSRADLWDAVDDKDAALRGATQYMEQTYRLMWSGTRNTDAQALSWPRADARSSDKWNYYANNVVPTEVVVACCELALEWNTASGLLIQSLGPEVASESVSGAVSVTYRAGSTRQITYWAAERLLQPLFANSSGTRYSGSVSRA